VLFKVVDGTTTITDGHLVFNTTYGQAFYDNLFNAAFVQMEYFGYLQRDPDEGGFNFWLAKLNQFGNWVDAQMVLAFIKSPEYRSRFGQP
jgi:predicted small integral membrane protein